MPETFWMEEYRKKALLPDALAQSGRGTTFTPVDFLYLAKQVVELLEINPKLKLLDVGCANGLFDILLSSFCHSILAIEPVPELVELARKNLAGCRNVRVEVGHGGRIPVPDGTFDRVLMLGVLQQVAPPEAKKIFKELKRVTGPEGRILIVAIPDKCQKQEFLDPYLEGVRQAAHLSEDEKKRIITRNEQAQWYEFEELADWWKSLGANPLRHGPWEYEKDQSPRFHLEVAFAN